MSLIIDYNLWFDHERHPWIHLCVGSTADSAVVSFIAESICTPFEKLMAHD